MIAERYSILFQILVRKLESFLLLHADAIGNLQAFCFFANIVTKFKKNGVKFVPQESFISISENHKAYYSYGNRQSFYRYRNGLDARQRRLSEEYLLSEVPVAKGDVVIDVGANFGDFIQIFKSQDLGLHLFCFEPDPIAFQVLSRNHPTLHLENLAVSDKNGYRSFIIATKTSDSSFILENDIYGNETKIVRVTRLDDYEPLSRFKKIRLLKIEAEGFEPEVLLGAVKILERIQYWLRCWTGKRTEKRDHGGGSDQFSAGHEFQDDWLLPKKMYRCFQESQLLIINSC